ncbi:MAG: hypothetical protein SNH13_00940 [Rikenellaceae bacterium]
MDKESIVKYIATFYLFAMCVQFIAIEGTTISFVKVGLMAIAPFIWLSYAPAFTKATAWSAAYMLVTSFAVYMQWDDARGSTILYSLLFFLLFNMYYALIYVKEAFTIDYYIKVIRTLIFAYAVTLFLQQILVTIGIRYLPVVNLMGFSYYTTFRLNTLAIEPSHAARLMTVAGYVLLKLLEIKSGGKQALDTLFLENKKTAFALLYVMVCIGSGTAFVGLAILGLYFIDRKYIAYIIPLFAVIYVIAISVDYEPLNRFIAVLRVSTELDSELMRTVDHSASVRTNIIFNTIKNLDLSDPNLLFGHGIDASAGDSTAVVSAIYDYGLVSYICKLGLFFSCCFSGLLSLPVLMFVVLFSFNIGNIAYGWAALMMFATLKYFQTQHDTTTDADVNKRKR